MTQRVLLPIYINGKPDKPFPVDVYAQYHVPQSGNAVVPLCDESGLDWLVASIREHTRQQFDVPIAITGKRRMGKSQFGLQLAKKLDPEIPLEHVTFELSQYQDLIRGTAPSQSPVYMYDESIEGMFKQEWQRQMAIVKTLNISGALLIKHIFIMPSLGDFNSKIKPMIAFWIYIEDRGLAIVEVSTVDKHNGSVWWEPIMAIHYGMMTGPFWDAYNDKKNGFISNYNPDKTPNSVSMEQRDALIKKVYAEGWGNQVEIGSWINMSQRNVSRILHS